MLLRDALPRFHAEAVAAIAAKPDDEIPEGLSKAVLIAQLERLIFLGGSEGRTGSFRVTMPGRDDVARGYAFSFDFYIPSGNVIADVDQDLLITSFEPISVSAIPDLQSQLDSLASRP